MLGVVQFWYSCGTCRSDEPTGVIERTGYTCSLIHRKGLSRFPSHLSGIIRTNLRPGGLLQHRWRHACTRGDMREGTLHPPQGISLHHDLHIQHTSIWISMQLKGDGGGGRGVCSDWKC